MASVEIFTYSYSLIFRKYFNCRRNLQPLFTFVVNECVCKKGFCIYIKMVKPKLVLLQFCIAAFLLLSEKGLPTIVLKRVIASKKGEEVRSGSTTAGVTECLTLQPESVIAGCSAQLFHKLP